MDYDEALWYQEHANERREAESRAIEQASKKPK